MRIALAAALLWVIAGIFLGTETALSASLGGTPVPLGDAIRGELFNILPWMPVIVIVVGITGRFPLTRSGWRRSLPVHLVMVPAMAYLANILVVLGFWARQGSFDGMGVLLEQALFWATMKVHLAALLYAAVAGLTQMVQYYRETRARELHVARLEGQLARARLDALNAQLRPHFLFNTLHTMGHLWRSGRPDEADRLLDHLGALFQKVQSLTSEPQVLLEEELGMVEEYLAIERARFPDRLSVIVEATDAAQSVSVPPLLLQPLVENAIRHGISQSSSPGRVEVRARVEEGVLRLCVKDDGPGPAAHNRTQGSGTGLRNTRERLRQLYGSAATLVAGEGDGGGYTVSIGIPIETPGQTPASSSPPGL